MKNFAVCKQQKVVADRVVCHKTTSIATLECGEIAHNIQSNIGDITSYNLVVPTKVLPLVGGFNYVSIFYPYKWADDHMLEIDGPDSMTAIPLSPRSTCPQTKYLFDEDGNPILSDEAGVTCPVHNNCMTTYGRCPIPCR